MAWMQCFCGIIVAPGISKVLSPAVISFMNVKSKESRAASRQIGYAGHYQNAPAPLVKADFSGQFRCFRPAFHICHSIRAGMKRIHSITSVPVCHHMRLGTEVILVLLNLARRGASLRRAAAQNAYSSQSFRSSSQFLSTSCWTCSIIHSLPGLNICAKRPCIFKYSVTGSLFFGL